MLMVVGLSLVAVLLIVIPMGSFHQDHNWILISLKALACIASAGLLLYFWIVVLELFLRLGPMILFDGPMGPVPGHPGGPLNPAAMQINYPLMYPGPGQNTPQIYQGQPPPHALAGPANQQMYGAHYGPGRPL